MNHAVRYDSSFPGASSCTACPKARGTIRAEMARQNVTYSQLSERLESLSVHEDERNLRNKVSRGKFTAAFLLQCLAALGSRDLHLG